MAAEPEWFGRRNRRLNIESAHSSRNISRFVCRTDASFADSVNGGMTASRWTLALLPQHASGRGEHETVFDPGHVVWFLAVESQ
jgi:hypothetical protein